MLEKVREMVNSCPVIMKGDYPYVILSLSDGIRRQDPSILREVIDRMKEIGDFNVDCIVAPEAMGIPYAIPLALELGIPFSIIRKRQYGLEGEVKVEKSTGYGVSTMYINNIGKGDRIILIDDMVSTGGTMRALIKALRSTGCTIVQVLVAIEKDCHVRDLSEELGVPIKAVFGIETSGNKVSYRDAD